MGAVKKTITSNSNTTELKTTPKKTTVIDQYYDMFFFKHRPVTETFLDTLAENYVKWFATNKEAILFTQFLQDQNINRSDFYRWILRSDKLQKAHEFVLMILCNRREVGAATKKYDSNMISKVHGHYSDIWVQETVRIAALTKSEEDKKQNITVIIDKFPESK